MPKKTVLERVVVRIVTRPTTKQERMYRGIERAIPRCDEVEVRPVVCHVNPDGGYASANGGGVLTDERETDLEHMHYIALRALAKRWGIRIAILGKK